MIVLYIDNVNTELKIQKIDCIFVFLVLTKSMSEIRFNQTVDLFWKKCFFFSQNMGTPQNCSLKQCISKLALQKYEHKQENILTDKFLPIKRIQ